MRKNRHLVKAGIIVLLLSMLLNACFKLEELRIDQESKDYCLFKEGSYWIFQDSATHKIDSVVINQEISYEFSQDGEYKRESYSTRVTSYSQDNISSWKVRLVSRFENCAFISDLFATMYHNGGEFEKIPNYHDVILVNKKDHYSITGITYSNVKIFEQNTIERINIFFWAKHIGLIRTEIYKDDNIIVKNLIRYNVKQ